eukprot:gene13632-biopygen5040
MNQEPRRRVPQSSADGLRGSALPRALRTAPWLNCGGVLQVLGSLARSQESGSGIFGDIRPRTNEVWGTNGMRLPRRNEIPGKLPCGSGNLCLVATYQRPNSDVAAGDWSVCCRSSQPRESRRWWRALERASLTPAGAGGGRMGRRTGLLLYATGGSTAGGACAWGGGGDGMNQEPRRRVPQSSADGLR